jgi:hypothetical protein
MRSLQVIREKALLKATVVEEANLKRDGLYAEYRNLSMFMGALDVASKVDPTGITLAYKAHYEAKRDGVKAVISARRDEARAKALYRVRQNENRYYTNIANLAKYYSHELAYLDSPPDQATFQRELAEKYYNSAKFTDALRNIAAPKSL